LTPFLSELAEKLFRDRKQLDAVTLVFPNRRAALYFRKYLSQFIDKPAFAPTLITIEEFIGSFSTLQVPDKLELIYRLHGTYTNVVKREEDFDQFYFWGDMLVRDFDEVDKYMVNAQLLFADLSHQKELDSRFDYLTEEQLTFLKEFWSGFDEKPGEYKKKFLDLWQQLPEVHTQYKEQLREAGLAYEGMVHREVAEKMMQGEVKLPNAEYWFVGFNALTKAEEEILSYVVSENKGTVHWDMDAYYLHNKTQEAGAFFREYQEHAVLGKTFPADVPANFQQKKSVQVIGAAQPVGQAKIMAQLLSEQLKKGINPEETLIVLPDEKLMLPVLHGIAGDVEKLNVTMGFPLSNTPMSNFIELLIELQINRKEDYYNHRQVLALLRHPYMMSADASASNAKQKIIQKDNWVMVPGTMLRTDHNLLKYVFCEVPEAGLTVYLREVIQLVAGIVVDEIDKEYAIQFLKLINRIEEVLGSTFSSPKAFLRMFRQLSRTIKIPFTGEPLRGLQVMGVLETRNLDFKNVFVLSLNEGALPSGASKGSYIPYTIRKAYNLPTVEHQDSIYAYLFYRVLQRAENVFLFYNTETDVLGQGEMSRYLRQLLNESNMQPQMQILYNDIQPLAIKPISITKDEKVIDILKTLSEPKPYGKFLGISPSALNSYIECQLRFYFQYVAKVREPDEVEEDIDARVLGNFLHDAMEHIYARLKDLKAGKAIEASDIKEVQKSIDSVLNAFFVKKYNLDPNKEVVLEGQRYVVREIVKQMVLRILKRDEAYTPFEIIAVEEAGMNYKVKLDNVSTTVVIGGKLDRVDKKGNTIRIVDYKTGKDKTDFDSVESLFIPDKDRNKAAFQTLLYALLYISNTKYAHETKFQPGLISRTGLFDDNFSFGLKMAKERITDALPLMPEFEARLKELVEELFNVEVPFAQTTVTENCRYCAYKNICYR
jgi:CRISPR/Cas system-associated exonuclease Cas4 (RecB family)